MRLPGDGRRLCAVRLRHVAPTLMDAFRLRCLAGGDAALLPSSWAYCSGAAWRSRAAKTSRPLAKRAGRRYAYGDRRAAGGQGRTQNWAALLPPSPSGLRYALSTTTIRRIPQTGCRAMHSRA